ncbi:DUF1064 domain-containing protein [Aneurinibacillus aneurinilyticus]|uniref:DUF1064 domain-containing protein n=1 Tax=Aneurinibacillus aneurinilyticus TaxID=1391 RepID=UPI0023F48747|nr:DUF1064 domain-containing protein [Aneurinibacillus aneurinilyticus]
MTRTKYGNRKTQADGIWFDSKAEARYYIFLKAQKQQGLIKDFILQPKFLLQEPFQKDGKTHKRINYVADFQVTHLDDSLEIIDVKGTVTKEFAIKEKLFNFRYRDLKLTIIDAKTLTERGKASDANRLKSRGNARTSKRKAK